MYPFSELCEENLWEITCPFLSSVYFINMVIFKFAVSWKCGYINTSQTDMWTGSDHWNNHWKMASTKRWDYPWPAVSSFIGLCWHCSRHSWIIWSPSRRCCSSREVSDICSARCVYMELVTVLSCYHSHNWKEQPDKDHKQQGGLTVHSTSGRVWSENVIT